MNRPLIVCHRGASHHAPENTIAAADRAIDLGADYIELDVRESADGVLFVMHDRTVDRTTDGTGEIGAMTAAEIARLDAGAWFDPPFSGERVPRLDDLLANLKGRAGAYVELKWCDPARVAATVRDLGMADDIFWYAHKPEMRDAMRAAAPDFRHMVTMAIARSPSVARSFYGASMLEMEVGEARPAVVDAARGIGLQTMIYYEGADTDTFRLMAAAGVDLVNIDHPDRFIAAIGGGHQS